MEQKSNYLFFSKVRYKWPIFNARVSVLTQNIQNKEFFDSSSLEMFFKAD